jgi:predicted ATPase
MLESIHFKNFKALRDATLPLSRFTLLLGPNGSGKSTVLQALDVNGRDSSSVAACASVGVDWNQRGAVEIAFTWVQPFPVARTVFSWGGDQTSRRNFLVNDTVADDRGNAAAAQEFAGFRVYALDAPSIALPVQIRRGVELARNGTDLAAVLDELQDENDVRFEALNAEIRRWLPEYDRIGLETTEEPGRKGFYLRTKQGGHRIRAVQLSQGTLLALAMLTLAYVPNPPRLVALEEPDRGIHPRLLRELRDALYRLAYPENCGESRPAVQVIVTSHSPYLLDLYRDHPEEIVLAEKHGLDVQFKRLSDLSHFEEILGDAPLSEVWYSGILGGVPATP